MCFIFSTRSIFLVLNLVCLSFLVLNLVPGSEPLRFCTRQSFSQLSLVQTLSSPHPPSLFSIEFFVDMTIYIYIYIDIEGHIKICLYKKSCGGVGRDFLKYQAELTKTCMCVYMQSTLCHLNELRKINYIIS